jgi:osmoprotectant transport system permease protein
MKRIRFSGKYEWKIFPVFEESVLAEKENKKWFRVIIQMGVFLLLVVEMEELSVVFKELFSGLNYYHYERTSFLKLTYQHVLMVFISGTASALTGMLLGIAVTRKRGREFLPVVNSMVSFSQTFPPVAVLALAVPLAGFGLKPTLIALYLYGLLPVVRNTISGLEGVSAPVLEAARGMGMRGRQVLQLVELPLAFPLIMAGIRTSFMINIGTATLGATIGAGGLGAPIIAGLIGENPVYIIEGALVLGFFALILDGILGRMIPERKV